MGKGCGKQLCLPKTNGRILYLAWIWAKAVENSCVCPKQMEGYYILLENDYKWEQIGLYVVWNGGKVEQMPIKWPEIVKNGSNWEELGKSGPNWKK